MILITPNIVMPYLRAGIRFLVHIGDYRSWRFWELSILIIANKILI